jgi:hypothetical protein
MKKCFYSLANNFHISNTENLKLLQSKIQENGKEMLVMIF